jgi:predicted TIM-barrel fold metal-dependent hydrolase
MSPRSPAPVPATALDFSQVPLIDEHCHGLYREQRFADAPAWRRLFTESTDEGMRREHVATTLFYTRMVRGMAEVYGCEPTEDAVLAARGTRDGHELLSQLMRAANVEALLIDQGYPPRSQLLPDEEVGELAGCLTAPMLRLEVLMQDLIAAHDTLADVTEHFRAALVDVRAQGYVAFKSIAAYRTGLNILRWEPADVERAFTVARSEAVERGRVRLAHKPLLDTLLHVAFVAAAEQELPVQFHVGYGDTDANMLLANPLHLRDVLETRSYRGMRVVLLHECYPYTREGAYLAAVYENVYFDLSYGIPFLGYDEMVAFTRATLGVAPLSKLLYSSDAVGVPELYWISARDGRRILGQALGECIASGDLNLQQAEAAGASILRDNAVALYGLGARLPAGRRAGH